MKITDDVYKVEGWKDIKTQLKFSNEYYKCKEQGLLIIDYSE